MMDIILALCASIFIAGISTTILITLSKWEVFRWYTDKRASNRFFAMLPEVCMFCLGFWTALALTIAAVYFGYVGLKIVTLAIPFASAGITQKLMS